MKVFVLVSAFSLSHVVASPFQSLQRKGPLSEEQILTALVNNRAILPPRIHAGIVERYHEGTLLQKRQSTTTSGGWMETIQSYGSLITSLPGMLTSMSTAPSSGNEPKSTVAEVQISESPTFPGAKSIKVRYGPFRMPPKNEKNFNYVWWKVQGAATSFRLNIKRPCETECTILGIQADIEYADGSPANASNGAIFHHSVLLNAGPNVVEPTCGQPFLENIFMTGNEKGRTDYALPNGMKSGYRIEEHDTFMLNTEVQNYSDKEKFVWETITYDIIDGLRQDYTPSKIVWLTIGTQENPSLAICHYFTGEFPWGPTNLTGRDQPTKAKFSEHSRIWRSDKEASIIAAAGHLHDGGTNVEIFQNNNLLCDSVARYEAGKGKAMSHDHGGMRKRQVLDGGAYSNTDIPHIAEVKRCAFPEGKPLKSGDGLYIAANYDLEKYKGVKEATGKIDMIMGMGGILIAGKDL